MPEPMSDEERVVVEAKLNKPGASAGQIRWARRRLEEDNRLLMQKARRR